MAPLKINSRFRGTYTVHLIPRGTTPKTRPLGSSRQTTERPCAQLARLRDMTAAPLCLPPAHSAIHLHHQQGAARLEDATMSYRTALVTVLHMASGQEEVPTTPRAAFPCVQFSGPRQRFPALGGPKHLHVTSATIDFVWLMD
ncbi:hypothetical protein NDU88_002041 [Pleurodeles waltl]|uniref:Uncharacterized protein n=1 Tax=Pleurodeles waltl TaxID=8319 RepID=A0AAV7U8K9_PLEWA|nr:hypothetical protein NDU88_002041 [Pleurodeles waltl]